MSREIQMKTKVKPYHLTCQNCYKQYETIKDFKVHVRSIGHKQEVARLFQTDVHQGPFYLPILAIMDYLRNPNQTDPLIGLDMVTFCITPEKYGAFYLCHICEERLSSQDIIQHLCSVEHYFKHLAYSNPELLRFAWFKDSFSYLQHSAVREKHTNGSGALRILELPKLLLKKGKKLLYHQVMTMFSKTGKLTECIRARRPQRKTLQAYITDTARTNPLLGLNFLVEYSCPDSEWHCGYLCILCKKKLPAIDGISHCISFDHVYWYLQEVHPATLECTKSTYTHYSYGFHQKILYLANQAQTHNPPEEIQSVHLDLTGFKDVASSSYKNALDKLQLIRRGKDQSEIKPSVTPGGQILYTAEDHELSVSKTTTVCLAEEKTHKDSGTQNGEHCQYILCVECDQTFSFITGYKNHIRGWEHGQKLVDLFGSGLYTGTISVIKLYQYLWARHLKDSPPPLIGLQLFTVLVDRQSPCTSSPLYLCHACEINISTSASAHLTSTQHYFNVFAHTKPDLVFLGARNSSNITEFAREEEARQGKENTVLRVCEIPSHLWRMFKSLAYEKIMVTIWKHHSKLNKCFEVPKRVTLQTYAKSGDRKSPLLGLQFMVKYSTTQPYPKCGYLCLLCERRLSEMHAIAHILSFSHVLAYLNVTHPGSLKKDDGDQRLLIVDLAQQAEKICHNQDLQEVELEFGKFHELDTSPFTAALNALQLYCRQKGLGELKTPVPGARLVSSLEKEHPLQSVQQESLSVASKTEQIHHDSTRTETSPPETDFKVPDVLKLEGPPKSTNTANSASTSAQHHYPMETDVEPRGHMPHYHNPTEAKEFYQTARPPQTKDSSFPQEQRELAHNQGNPSEAPQNILQTPTCINKPQAVLQSSTKLWNYLKTTNREPVIGMNSVIECHSDGKPPIFICVSCTKLVKESSVVKHLTSRDHQIIYMKSVKYAPVLAKRKVKTKWLRIHAILLEKSEGYGETQLLELDAKDFHEILCSPIVSVLRKLRDSLLKMTSENGDQCAKAVDDSRSDDRPETLESLKKPEGMDGPCGQIRRTAISNDSNPDTTLKQCSDEDPIRSSPHLWSYLSSPSRTEPIIGLNMVTEYRSSSSQSSFLCSCCKVLLPTSKYMCHLISPRHRFTYLKEKHPKLVELWKDQVDLTYKIAELQAKAKSVQDSEGWGQLKVVKRESPNLKEQAAKNVENSNDGHQAESPQAGSAAVCTEPQGQNSKRQNPTKLLKMKKMNKQSAVIGLNFVTCVSHEKKKLFFCELCSVRCHVEHMSSETHKKTCVEHRYPGWTKSDPSMKRLDDITLHLAAVERSTGIGIKKLSVTAEVFTALRTAPISEALSQLKLQQTKLEAGVDLRGSCSSVVMNSSKATDHGTNNDVKNHMPSVPAAIRSLEPEHAPVLETSVMSDESPDPLSGSHSGPLAPLGPCSISVVPVLPHATLLSPSDVHTQAEPYSRISPPQTVLYNIQASSVPLPPSVPDLPPLSVSYNPQPVYDPLPVFSNPDNSMRFSPPPIYEPVSPPLMYEPISPPSLYEPGSPPSPKPISPSYSGSPYSPTTSIASSLPQPSKRQLIEVENQADVFTRTVLRVESRRLVPAPHMNSSLNLPTVAGQSNAYLFLSLRNLFSTEPIIGLSNILECRTTARPTFFLCLNCAVKIITKDFCCHMTSERHQYISIRIQYPEIFQKWQWQTNHKLTIHDLAERLALEEQGLDAKVIKLDQKQYENLQSADFLNAIEILQRMFGPEPSQSSLSSPLRGQTQREIFAERLLKDCEETDTHRHQPQQNWNFNSSQHGLHSGFIGLDSMQGNRSTRDRVLCSQSPQKTRKDPEVTMVQAQQTQPQFNLQAGLTAESESINTESRSSEMHTESISETPGACCANSLPSQSPESTVQGLQPITAQTFPCLIKEIKQEKPDYDEASQRTCSFAADVVPSLEVPCSKEAAEGKPFKHSTNLKEYINSKRAVSDAVVGLSSVIQCQCEGQAPLYLCVSCSRKLNHDLIINHLLKPGHRDSYLRRRYPWMFEDLSDSDSKTQTFVMLMRLAQKVEKTYEDEPGQLQVMEVQFAELKEIRSLSFDQAITQLQKIREEQGLCALQTCISPKIQTVLVKKEKIEMEVTTQHSTQLADLPEMIAQRPKTTSKRKAAEPDSLHETPPLVKQMKLSSTVSSGQKLPDQPKPRTCDHHIPSSSRPHTPKNSTTSKESLDQNHANTQQKPIHADLSHVSRCSSESSPPRPKDQYSWPTLKPTTSNKPSQKSSVQTKSVIKTNPKYSIPDTYLTVSDPQLVTQTPTNFGSETHAEQSGEIISKASLKRQHSESTAVPSLSRKQSTDDPPRLLSHSPSVLNIPVLSECPVKRCSVEALDKKEISALSTVLSDKSQSSHSKSSRSSDPSTPTERATLNQPMVLAKNSNGQDLSSPNLAPQQKLPCPNDGVIHVLPMNAQGHEIARLHERSLVNKRLNENTWNYENRQFSSDTVNTSLVGATSGEANWNVPANDAEISGYACADNTSMSYPIPAHNANSYFFVPSGCGEPTSVISPVMPGYPMPYAYHWYKQADSAPASVASSCMPPNYPVATDKSAINAQSTSAGIPTNAGYFTNSNLAYASQLVYQSQQVYQPLHGFQSPEAYQAYYAFCAYNQAHQTNQATTLTGSITSGSSTDGHMPTN